jgi:hypothetical protein
MRNLVVYPVVAEEAISATQIAFEDYARNIHKVGVGNIDGVALLMAEKFIENNKDSFNAFSAECMKRVGE